MIFDVLFIALLALALLGSIIAFTWYVTSFGHLWESQPGLSDIDGPNLDVNPFRFTGGGRFYGSDLRSCSDHPYRPGRH